MSTPLSPITETQRPIITYKWRDKTSHPSSSASIPNFLISSQNTHSIITQPIHTLHIKQLIETYT